MGWSYPNCHGYGEMSLAKWSAAATKRRNEQRDKEARINWEYRTECIKRKQKEEGEEKYEKKVTRIIVVSLISLATIFYSWIGYEMLKDKYGWDISSVISTTNETPPSTLLY